mgnify:CR=1 FL=1
MEDLEQKKKRIMEKFKASRDRKKVYLQEMEKRMRHDFKQRTGMEAGDFNYL